MLRPIKKQALRNEQADEAAYLAHLAAQRNASAFFEKYERTYNLTNAIRMTEDHLDAFSYQRLQQRLTLQLKLVKKHLEKKEDIQKNIAYMKLICFLIPFIINLKRKNKVPNLSRLLQPYSDDKVKTERELPPFMLGTDFKCQHFLYAQNQYFHLHGGIEFDVGTPSVEDVSKEVKSLSFGMKSAADRGLAAIFLTFCRRTSINSLAITDDNGYAYIHHAAIYNRVAIIAQVVKLHLTINQKRSIPASQGKRFQRPETKSGRPAFIEKDVMIGERSCDYWKCILQAGTIPSLISLLKSKDVKLECITLGVLSNISTHDSIVRAFVEAGGIPVLIKLLTVEEPELLSRCAVFLYDIAQLDNNQVIIAELGGIPALIDLLEYDLQDLLVNVMSCIRVLCKNNKENQLKVKEMIGIEPLVQFLRSDSGKLIASLAHTRAGIPEAITSLGTVQRLCYHLYAKEEEVRSAVACALGYLTFNRTAYRHLLVQCRNKPKLFKRLIINLSKDAKINSDFVKEFKRQKKVGLPSLSLEINGGPPAVPVHIREKFRDN
ncbi:ankyrin and armadillo repeat-containing protein [Crotalus adamanteus]|uniref:Ankyrin and armadillo repeat-containing protein n=1 Tax=Crotalus adamanteus TaxID=8729 RepID=A0AAW1C921_CROAD